MTDSIGVTVTIWAGENPAKGFVDEPEYRVEATLGEKSKPYWDDAFKVKEYHLELDYDIPEDTTQIRIDALKEERIRAMDSYHLYIKNIEAKISDLQCLEAPTSDDVEE